MAMYAKGRECFEKKSHQFCQMLLTARKMRTEMCPLNLARWRSLVAFDKSDFGGAMNLSA